MEAAVTYKTSLSEYKVDLWVKLTQTSDQQSTDWRSDIAKREYRVACMRLKWMAIIIKKIFHGWGGTILRDSHFPVKKSLAIDKLTDAFFKVWSKNFGGPKKKSDWKGICNKRTPPTIESIARIHLILRKFHPLRKKKQNHDTFIRWQRVEIESRRKSWRCESLSEEINEWTNR